MSISHGGFTIDIPATWTDQSTLLFVAPSLGGDIPTLANSNLTQAISVNFLATDNDNPKELLAQQRREMTDHGTTIEVLEEGIFESKLGLGWHTIQHLSQVGVAVEVTQIVTACKVGPLAILATAVAPKEGFPQLKNRLLHILKTMGSKSNW